MSVVSLEYPITYQPEGISFVNLSPRLLENNPIFRNFLTASSISLLGNNIFDISMPLYVMERTHSPWALAMVSVALQLPYFVMAPLTGYLVDYHDNRKLMLLADIGQVLLLSCLVLFDFTSSDLLWPIILAIFAVKTLAILFETVTTFHLIPSLVKVGDLSDANTWFLSSQRLIQIAGPMLGGLLVGLAGFRASIFINIFSFGATLYFVYKMRELSHIIHHGQVRSSNSRLPIAQVRSSFTQSVKTVWRKPLFRGLVFTMFFWNLSSLTPNTASITYYFLGVKNYSAVDYGAVLSIFGIFSIVGFFLSPGLYRKHGFKTAFYFSAIWQAAFSLVAVCFTNFPMLFVLFFSVSRMGSAVMSMGTFLIRQTEVPRERSGAINSTLRMHFMSAGPLSAGLQGKLMEGFGVVSSFAMGALCLVLTAWWGKKTADAYPNKPTQPIPANTDLAA